MKKAAEIIFITFLFRKTAYAGYGYNSLVCNPILSNLFFFSVKSIPDKRKNDYNIRLNKITRLHDFGYKFFL